METFEDIKLDIVKLIEKNPVIRLSKNYQNKLVNKIKNKFTENEQRLFASSFYCYLNFNSKDDYIVNIDDIWKWIGFARKDNAKRLLDKYFTENIDYKIIFPRSGENLKGGRPEEQLFLTINTFKKFCLKAGTKKADEIHDYYIKLEELLNETINEETSDLRNQLILKDVQHEKNIKMKRHDTLIELLKTKRCCVYVGEIEDNKKENDPAKKDIKKFIKIGSSKEVDIRAKTLNNDYNNLIFLEIFECENFREVEENILNDPLIVKNLYKNPIKVNGGTSREVVQLSENFNYEQLLSIVKHHVNTGFTNFMTSTQFLEKQKMEIEKQKIEIEKQKIEIEKQKTDRDFLLSILNNDKYSNKIQKIIDDIFPDMLRNITTNINKEQVKEHIKEQVNEKVKEEVKGQIKEQVQEHIKDQEQNKNPNNNIVLEVNRNRFKPRGRKIQKIDPNNLKNVVKIYDSMIYLLRSKENERFKKPSIEKAIANNILYQGYRWNFVEKNADPNISTALPTENLKIKKDPDTDVILQLNETKTKILGSFSTRRELVKILKISKKKLNKIINDDNMFNNNYYTIYSKCSPTLLNDYCGSTTRIIHGKGKRIKQINPITKDEIIFNTYDEINIKVGFRRPTIKNAIKNKTLLGGSIWEYCNNDS